MELSFSTFNRYCKERCCRWLLSAAAHFSFERRASVSPCPKLLLLLLTLALLLSRPCNYGAHFRNSRPNKSLSSLAFSKRRLRKPSGVTRLNFSHSSVETMPSHVLDGRRAWLVCVAALLSNIMAQAWAGFSFGVIFPVLLEEYGRGKAKTGTN